MSISLERLGVDDFAPLVGTDLPAEAEGARLPLRLEAATPSPYPTSRPVPGFSLQLRGPAQTPWQQGMLRLEHPVHGALELFFTPLRRDARGVVYEIVFN